MRDIDQLLPKIGQLEQQHGFIAPPMFSEVWNEPRRGEGKRRTRAYDMTKTGFTLLAMGYTGEKALQFKLRYIEQFNTMEAELKAQAQPAAATATSGNERVLRTIELMQQQIVTPLLQLVTELVRLQQKPS